MAPKIKPSNEKRLYIQITKIRETTVITVPLGHDVFKMIVVRWRLAHFLFLLRLFGLCFIQHLNDFFAKSIVNVMPLGPPVCLRNRLILNKKCFLCLCLCLRFCLFVFCLFFTFSLILLYPLPPHCASLVPFLSSVAPRPGIKGSK